MYRDDLLNIDNPYFESMVNQIYQPQKPKPLFEIYILLFQMDVCVCVCFFCVFFFLIYDITRGDFDIVHFPFFEW